MKRHGVSSPQRRPSSAVAWVVNRKAATALLGRRRPASPPGEPGRSAPPGGARHRHCARRAAPPDRLSGTMPCPVRPREAPIPRTRFGLGLLLLGRPAPLPLPLPRTRKGSVLVAPTFGWASVPPRRAMTPIWRSALQDAVMMRLRHCASRYPVSPLSTCSSVWA